MRSLSTVSATAAWQKAQRLRRIAEYQENAMRAYRAGRYLDSSRWTDLADYEHERLTHELNKAARW